MTTCFAYVCQKDESIFNNRDLLRVLGVWSINIVVISSKKVEWLKIMFSYVFILVATYFSERKLFFYHYAHVFILIIVSALWILNK